MNRKSWLILILGLLAIAGAVSAETPVPAPQPPAAEAPQTAAALPATADGACQAKPVSAFDYPTCSCGDHLCNGQYVGTICGLDEFGQLMVCQDQLVGCYPQPYPDTIFCRCTSGIVP